MNIVAIFQAAILGLIEGLTEFLPISSSGHLIVASAALGFNDPNKTFEVVIQLGAILAVIWYYRLEIIKRVTGLFSNNLTDQKFWINIVVATMPALILIPLEKPIKAALFKPVPVAIALIFGGVILWFVEQRIRDQFAPKRSNPHGTASSMDGLRNVLQEQHVSQRDGQTHVDTITIRDSIVIGLAQVLAAVRSFWAFRSCSAEDCWICTNPETNSARYLVVRWRFWSARSFRS
jgi:undecaprenyl pyrophosphate phosphatase UppP